MAGFGLFSNMDESYESGDVHNESRYLQREVDLIECRKCSRIHKSRNFEVYRIN